MRVRGGRSRRARCMSIWHMNVQKARSTLAFRKPAVVSRISEGFYAPPKAQSERTPLPDLLFLLPRRVGT